VSLKDALFPPAEQTLFEHTFLQRERLEEQYANLEQQSETAAFGMWVFLATEVMFFGALFVSVGAYWLQYTEAVEKASVALNWKIGAVNTVVLLVSSLMMFLAVHSAKEGQQRRVVFFLLATAALGGCFLILKGTEYYFDFVENLVPWRFDQNEWMAKHHMSAEQTGHARVFLLFYWAMTGLHALHMTIGIVAVLIICALARRGHYSAAYYSPVDVLGLYWHFVDLVWIFLFPLLYLLGTHHL
jgi:cytochrome c oxidase subunit III